MARVDAWLVSTAGMLSWLAPDWGRQCNRQWSSDIAPGSAVVCCSRVCVDTHIASGPLRSFSPRAQGKRPFSAKVW